jgi:hypothetical protein
MLLCEVKWLVAVPSPPRQRAAAVLLGANATLLFGCGSWLLDGGIRGDNQVLDYAYEPVFSITTPVSCLQAGSSVQLAGSWSKPRPRAPTTPPGTRNALLGDTWRLREMMQRGTGRPLSHAGRSRFCGR